MFTLIKPGTNFDILSKQRPLGILSVLAVLASILVIVFVGPNYGIDFKGGSDIILTFKQPVGPDQVRDAAKSAGFSDASVQRFGPEDRSQFLIQTSAVSVVDAPKIKALKAEIEKTVKVEREVWSLDQPDRYDLTLAQSVDPASLIAAAQTLGLQKVEAEAVGAEQDRKYTIRFQDLGSYIRASFTASFPEAFDGKTGLDRLETVGARVGNQLRDDGITAFLLALLAILIYIAVRFDVRFAPGAVLALAHDVIIAFGVLTLLKVEINLPILAAALTIVGYSLNDTIVVFDRVRENYTAGRGGNSLAEIVNTSINESLTRTIITSLTTFLAVAVIAILGSGLIANFAITLVIGIIVGTYSSIFVASPVLLIMDGWLRTRQEARALRRKDASPIIDELVDDRP